jgi:hypothetical protein
MFFLIFDVALCFYVHDQGILYTNGKDGFRENQWKYTTCSLEIQVVKMLCFLAAWAEVTNQPKGKQIAFHRGDFEYHRLLLTVWFAPRSQI